MTEEERAVLDLPPVLQKRMAVPTIEDRHKVVALAALAGVRFYCLDNHWRFDLPSCQGGMFTIDRAASWALRDLGYWTTAEMREYLDATDSSEALPVSGHEADAPLPDGAIFEKSPAGGIVCTEYDRFKPILPPR